MMVEDVTTSGKSIGETYPLITEAARVEVVGLVVSLDRQEVGPGGVLAATQEVAQTYGFPVHSIVTMEEVVTYLQNEKSGRSSVLDDAILERITAYYQQYGAQGA